MAGCATCNSRPRTSWKMLLVGCYWVCLCHIIVGGSTLHDVISAAASVDGTTGRNNNKSNGTSDKKKLPGDDDMPFHWPPTLLNQQHRSFSSFSGQGVQIHTSKRKPEDPDVGVLVRILRSATPQKAVKGSIPVAASASSSANNGKASLVSSPSSSSSSSTGRRQYVKRLRRRRRNIIKGDNNNNNHSKHRITVENPSSGRRERLVVGQRRPQLRKPRSASAAITKKLDMAPLTAPDANGHILDHQSPSTIPLQYIIVVILGVPVAELNQSSLQALRVAFSQALKIPLSYTGIDKIRLQGNSVEMFFIKPGRSSAPFKLGDFLKASTILASNNLLSNVQTQIPQLQIESLQPATDYRISMEESFWVEPYFPYIIASCVATVVIVLVAIMIYCCYRQKMKKAELENPTVQRIFYPTLKPNVKDAMMVQPESSPVYVVKRCVTPLPAQTPVQMRSEGLLKRRGSSASLTLDLNPSPELPRWEGTPPKESSGLEYLMSAGNRLSRRDLRNAVKNVKSVYEEFWEIPTNHPEKVYVAGSGTKNRYKTMIPNEHSRVILPNYEGDTLSSYVNANYIRGYEVEACAYIATQGPMAHTIVDFWRMVWHEKSPIIVMITKLKEKNQSKCENYLPEKIGGYGDIEVTVDKVAQRPGYLMHFLTLRNFQAKGETHKVVHYWYTAWPDHKPPDSPKMILDLVREVELRRYQDDGVTPKGPVTVHCSAGIGRTGCFIAISIGIRQLREEHSVDVLGIVCSMRMDRGGMIQTHEQYEFIHQALCEYEKMLDAAGGD